MQTFLTSDKGLNYAGYAESAKSLDDKRLAKQVLENYQLFCAMQDVVHPFSRNMVAFSQSVAKNLPEGVKETLILSESFREKINNQTGWKNHPAMRMWKNNPHDHFAYSIAMADENAKRKHNSHAFVSHFVLYCGIYNPFVMLDAPNFAVLGTVIAIAKERLIMKNTAIPWEHEYIKVLDSHRGNLYLKNPLKYGRWYSYKHIPYQYPNNSSDTGYYWPV